MLPIEEGRGFCQELPLLLEDLESPPQGDEFGVLGAGPAQLGIGRCLEYLAPVPDGHTGQAEIGTDRLG